MCINTLKEMEDPLLWLWLEELNWSVVLGVTPKFALNQYISFATYFMTLKRKEKTQSNQTNSFSMSNIESELWNSCFRYKQWSWYKTTQRNKFYFLPTDGNQQMLKSAAVIDKHVDIHSYVLITSSLGKLWRKAKVNHLRGFGCSLSERVSEESKRWYFKLTKKQQ